MMWSIGWWHWLWMAGFWVLVVLAVAWAVARLFPAAGPPAADARARLDERLARGEVGPDEYRRLRQLLER